MRYSVLAYMQKESEKEWIHAHVQLTHFSVHLKLRNLDFFFLLKVEANGEFKARSGMKCFLF